MKVKDSAQELTWTPELVGKFWDWQSQFPERYFTNLYGDTIFAFIRPFLSNRRKILDYGCGPGFLIGHLLSQDSEIYGADLSAESLVQVEEKFKHHPNFIEAKSISDLEGSPDRFDAIISNELIEHLYDADLEQMLRTCRSALSTDGILILTTPNDERLQDNMVFCPVSQVYFHQWQHVRSFSADSLSLLLKDNGFKVILAREVNLAAKKSMVSSIKTLLNILLRRKIQHPHLICVAQASED